jgi:hypothetical protein
MSPSRLEMLQRCGFAFFCRYVEGIKSPPTAALAFGSAFDDAANDASSAKIVSRETPKPADVAARFDAAWSTRSREVEDWSEDESPAELLDLGTSLAERWTSRFLSVIQPLEVQPRLSIELETSGETWNAYGFADVDALLELPGPAAGRRVVIDNKTSKNRWSADRLQSSTQAAFYVEAMRRRTGDPIDRAVWAISVKSKRKPDVQVLSRRVDASERAGVLHRFAAARELVRALYSSGAWLPNRTNPLCSRRWCAYFARCERTWGGTVRD